MVNRPVRIGSVSSDNLIQVGIQTVLQRHDDLDIVFVASDYNTCEELCKDYNPDVLLWLILPQSEQIVSVITAYCQTHTVPVLILAVMFDETSFYTLLKAGICGYFYTCDDVDLLVNAIRTIAKGNKWYSPSIAVQLWQKKMAEIALPPRSSHGNDLTAREVHILQMVAQGWSNQRIGQSLGVTERTIRSHMRNIYDKLQLANRAEAIVWTLNARLS